MEGAVVAGGCCCCSCCCCINNRASESLSSLPLSLSLSLDEEEDEEDEEDEDEEDEEKGGAALGRLQPKIESISSIYSSGFRLILSDNRSSVFDDM